MEILQVVSTQQGREARLQVVSISSAYDGSGGPRIDRLAGLLWVMYQSTGDKLEILREIDGECVDPQVES